MRSIVVSGDSRASDIKDEIYQESGGLLIFRDEAIKVSQPTETKAFLSAFNLGPDTPIYKIKTGSLMLFGQKLLYWGVYLVVLIFVLFMVVLSLPDKKTTLK